MIASFINTNTRLDSLPHITTFKPPTSYLPTHTSPLPHLSTRALTLAPAYTTFHHLPSRVTAAVSADRRQTAATAVAWRRVAATLCVRALCKLALSDTRSAARRGPMTQAPVKADLHTCREYGCAGMPVTWCP